MESATPTPVHPEEIYELRGWPKCDREQSAQISVVTRYIPGNTLEWMAGQVSSSGTHDWTELKSRVVIPDGCASILYRLTGTGTGTVWLDDASLVKVGDMTALRAEMAGHQYRLQNKILDVVFHPATASFDITDKRTGKVDDRHPGRTTSLSPGLSP